MFVIKDNRLKMYDISEEYKNYLRSFDNRVSKKEKRKFYGILVSDGKFDYYIPFTSRTNKNTSSKLTVNIKDGKNVIAKLLLNNMIPVNMEDSRIVDILKSKYRDYYIKEISYLRSKKIQDEMLRKINNIFYVLEDTKHTDYIFFKKLCCDFRLLEEKCIEYKKSINYN